MSTMHNSAQQSYPISLAKLDQAYRLANAGALDNPLHAGWDRLLRDLAKTHAPETNMTPEQADAMAADCETDA